MCVCSRQSPNHSLLKLRQKPQMHNPVRCTSRQRARAYCACISAFKRCAKFTHSHRRLCRASVYRRRYFNTIVQYASSPTTPSRHPFTPSLLPMHHVVPFSPRICSCGTVRDLSISVCAFVDARVSCVAHKFNETEKQ